MDAYNFSGSFSPRECPSELNAEISSPAILSHMSESSTHWHVCLLNFRELNFQESS